MLRVTVSRLLSATLVADLTLACGEDPSSHLTRSAVGLNTGVIAAPPQVLGMQRTDRTEQRRQLTILLDFGRSAVWVRGRHSTAKALVERRYR